MIARRREASLNGVHHFWLANISGNLGETSAPFSTPSGPGGGGAVRRRDHHGAGELRAALRATYADTRWKASPMAGRRRPARANGRALVARPGPVRAGAELFHIGDFVPALARWTACATSARRLVIAACRPLRRGRRAAPTRSWGDRMRRSPPSPWCGAGVGSRVRATALGYLGAAYLENEELAQAIPLLQDAIAQHQQLGSAGGIAIASWWDSSRRGWEKPLGKGRSSRHATRLEGARGGHGRWVARFLDMPSVPSAGSHWRAGAR